MIASTLESIHGKFNLSTKITTTITDNGSNFVKAFNMFSDDSSTDADATQQHLSQNLDSGKIVFTNIHKTLQDGHYTSDEHHFLPQHQICAAHTLNLL